MQLNEFFRALSTELVLIGPRYESQRFDHPALASYSTLHSLLLETEPKKEGKKRAVTPEGAAILCALVDLHARTRDRLWGAVLLRAFRPMIKNLAKRLIGGSPDERCALLLASFHQALLRVDPSRDPLRIAMYVRQETRRGVFRELRKELDWQDIGFGTDADLCPDPTSLVPRLLGHEWLASEARPDGGMHVLLRTTGDRGDLLGHVRRHYGSLPPKEQARVYRRLQKRRHRFVGRLRQRLTSKDGSPTRVASSPPASVTIASEVES